MVSEVKVSVSPLLSLSTSVPDSPVAEALTLYLADDPPRGALELPQAETAIKAAIANSDKHFCRKLIF